MPDQVRQRTRDELRRASSAEIVAWHAAGALQALLAGHDPPASSAVAPGAAEQLTRADLRAMTPAEIVKAQAEGRLERLLSEDSAASA